MRKRALFAALFAAATLQANAAHAAHVPKPEFPPDVCTKYYPADAAAAHAEGETSLVFDVTADGRTADIRIETPSGNAALDEAALSCAAGLRYHTNGAWHWMARIAFGPGPDGPGSLLYVPHTCEDYYPPNELADRIEGTTRLSFTVRTDGFVENIAVAKSSGNEELDKAAVRCAGAWHYRPAVADGKPTTAPWQADVVWKAPAPEPSGRKGP